MPWDKNLESDIVNAYIDITRDTPLFLYATAHILDEPPPWMAYFSPKKQIRTFEYGIHWNINIWNKNSLRKNKW